MVGINVNMIDVVRWTIELIAIDRLNVSYATLAFLLEADPAHGIHLLRIKHERIVLSRRIAHQ